MKYKRKVMMSFPAINRKVQGAAPVMLTRAGTLQMASFSLATLRDDWQCQK
jgi:hypothetical protein